MQVAIKGCRLAGIVCAVPGNEVINKSIEDFPIAEIEKTTQLTGVQRRRVASNGTTTADLCEAAAIELMQDLSWSPDTIDVLIFLSQTPDYRLPATACALQHRLRLSNRTACFDVNLGCSGFPYALWMAASFLNGGGCKRVLLLVGETPSQIVSKKDRASVLLFGDAGSATAIESDSTAPASTFVLGTDGAGVNSLIIPRGGCREPSEILLHEALSLINGELEREATDLYMNGGDVFAFTLKSVAPLVRELLHFSNLSESAIDSFVLHQANGFMLKHIIKKLGFKKEKFPMNIDRFGNTSSASIPLVICSELGLEYFHRRRSLALIGFGVGFSWSACHLYIERPGSLKLISN